MANYTKLIVGLHLPAPRTIVIDGPNARAIDLTIAHGNTSVNLPYDAAKHNWSTPLPAGDYVLSLEVPDKQWWDDDVTVHAQDNQGLTFVVRGPYNGLAETTVAWTATSAKGDPKDPWPPPMFSSPEPLDAIQKGAFDIVLHNARLTALAIPRDFDAYAAQ